MDPETTSESPEGQIAQKVCKVYDAAQNLVLKEQKIEFLFQAKFTKMGYDPLDPKKPMNLMEQINQSLTLLTTYWVESLFPGKYFKESPGVQNGPDLEIYSLPSQNNEEPEYVFEIFAATDPCGNDKLFKDLQLVSNREGKERFVCFCSPNSFSCTLTKNNCIEWESQDSIEENTPYYCRCNKNRIGVLWIKPDTLKKWAIETISKALKKQERKGVVLKDGPAV